MNQVLRNLKLDGDDVERAWVGRKQPHPSHLGWNIEFQKMEPAWNSWKVGNPDNPAANSFPLFDLEELESYIGNQKNKPTEELGELFTKFAQRINARMAQRVAEDPDWGKSATNCA